MNDKKYLLATSAFSDSELLKKCIASWPVIDNVTRLVFFDGKKWEEEFKDVLEDENLENYVDIYFSAYEHRGASGGWNQILEYGFEENDYDYVIIMGTDTEMREGFWDKLMEDLERENPDFSCCMGFNCFVMNRECYKTVGNFDENYFPAYFEDNDYDTRVRLSKDTIKYHNCGDESLLGHYGSAIIRKNENYNKANGMTFPMNQDYHVKKWGCTRENPGAYTYTTPFNNPDLTVKYWKLDEEVYLRKREIWEKLENGEDV